MTQRQKDEQSSGILPKHVTGCRLVTEKVSMTGCQLVTEKISLVLCGAIENHTNSPRLRWVVNSMVGEEPCLAFVACPPLVIGYSLSISLDNKVMYEDLVLIMRHSLLL